MPKTAKHSIALVAPFPPPLSGMGLQAKYLSELIERDGATVIELDTLSGLDRLKRLRRIVRLLKKTRNMRNADAVLIFAGSYASFFVFTALPLFIAKLYRKPTVILYKGGRASEFLKSFGWIALPILRLADVVSVPGPFLQRIFESYSINATIIPDIINTSHLEENDTNTATPIVAMLRRHYPIYGIDIGIRVAKNVYQTHPHVKFVIANDGGETDTLIELAERIAPHNTEFVGPLSSTAVAELYKNATLLLNTNRFDNHPGTLIEAAATGLPIVSTAAGGIPLMFDNGSEALLAPIDDINELTRYVIRVVDNEALRNTLVEKARIRAKKLYWDVEKKGILTQYLSLIENKIEK